MADHNADILPPTERKSKVPIFVFFNDARSVFKRDEIGMEILSIAFPAALALAADPVASLIDTAFIGHLGPVEIAAVGVAIAIFNQASKVTIFPLVSITTSFVAEEDTAKRISDEQQRKIIINNNVEMKAIVPEDDDDDDDDDDDNLEKGSTTEKTDEEDGLKTTNNCKSPNNEETKNVRRHIPSASTAMALGGILGLLQTLFLILLAKQFLHVMGVKSGSPMLAPALKYLTIRSIGAPAVLLSLAMQGIFRGFKDTKTPLYATGNNFNFLLVNILVLRLHLFEFSVSPEL
ncbi:hypothetical protein RD792_015529 [Penstemon davidsonii]|uniref:Uncharacterized protein n=1 Tax=Penstemon davidsonii TaxID=160366 RepID=A0ABR0CJL0_9LAMI|nr:hypothetical protein RD792_015529 [Penstemon davidsonii]